MKSLIYSPRIDQLEAELIDGECKQLLSNFLSKAFETVAGKHLYKFQYEMDLIIDFLYFRFTVAKSKPQPGQYFLNCIFSDRVTGGVLTQKQKGLYFLVLVLGRYVWRRTAGKFENASKILEFLFAIACLIHFAMFLRTSSGAIPNLLPLSVLGICLTQIKPNHTRELDFEMLNRTLIWDVFGQILGFAYLAGGSLVSRIKSLFYMSSFLGSLSANSDGNECPVCKEALKVMPVLVEPCTHSFCYYCFRTQDETTCPKCRQPILSWKMIE